MIRRTIGFGLLNSMVLRVLERWIRRTLLLASALVTEPSCGVSNDQEDPEWWEPTISAPKDGWGSAEEKASMLESLATLTHQCFLRRSEAAGLGPDHPDALSSLHALAGLRRLQGRKGEALELCVSCMRRREKALGRKHRDTRRSALALAMLHRERGDTAAEEAVQIEFGLKAAPSRRGWAGLRGFLGGGGGSRRALGTPTAASQDGAAVATAVKDADTASGKGQAESAAGSKLAAIVKLRRIISRPHQQDNGGEGAAAAVAAAGQGGSDIKKA